MTDMAYGSRQGCRLQRLPQLPNGSEYKAKQQGEKPGEGALMLKLTVILATVSVPKFGQQGKMTRILRLESVPQTPPIWR
jgi:hypothetical protein